MPSGNARMPDAANPGVVRCAGCTFPFVSRNPSRLRVCPLCRRKLDAGVLPNERVHRVDETAAPAAEFIDP